MKQILQNVKNLFEIKKNRKRGIHKNKRTLKMNIKEFFYPSIGIKAWIKYMRISLSRKPATSHQIALGFAAGVFISFTPFVGFHCILAALIAYLLSANIVSSLLGTLIGNPWTFPIIWAWTLKFGNYILYQKEIPPENLHLMTKIHDLLHLSILELIDVILKIIYPMIIGGIPTGLLFGLLFYFIVKYNIDKCRDIRQKILEKKRAELKAKRIQKIKDTFSLKDSEKKSKKKKGK